MSVLYTCFLEIAKYSLEKNGELRTRNAISRAYYGMYHSTLSAINDVEKISMMPWSTRGRLSETLYRTAEKLASLQGGYYTLTPFYNIAPQVIYLHTILQAAEALATGIRSVAVFL